MQSYELIGGPLAESAIWRGALFWALALYIPLSGPLARFEKSLESSPLPESGRVAALIASSLLLAMGVGLVVQLIFSWTLGPGWASSLALIGIGWSLLLLLSSSGRDDN